MKKTKQKSSSSPKNIRQTITIAAIFISGLVVGIGIREIPQLEDQIAKLTKSIHQNAKLNW